MVRCFLIHTVCPASALGPGESRVLYSRVFGPDEGIGTNRDRDQVQDRDQDQDHDRDQDQDRDRDRDRDRDQDLSPEEKRLLQREKVSVVARQVRSAVSLSREASGRLLVELVPGEEALALQEAEGGVVRLRAGDPFLQETSAVWISVQSLSFTLVCEAHENLLLAEGTLKNLSRQCLENLHLLGPGSEVLLRSNRIDALLSRLLPHGQLLFLNHRFLHSLEKEVSSYMAK